MAWTVVDGICDRCGRKGRLSPAFGKHICETCKQNRPNKGTGNSGMRATGQPSLHSGNGLELVRVPKSDGMFGKLFFEHYPGSKGIPGRSLCYLIYMDSAIIGIIGVNSPPHNYGLFRRYFGCDNDNCFVNNNVFRLIRNEQNLGTRVLKMFRNRILVDYFEKYGERLIGVVTFVEPPRTGAMYKADNWDFIGMTAGKRMRRDKDTWEKVFSDGVPKHVFGYKYRHSKRSRNGLPNIHS